MTYTVSESEKMDESEESPENPKELSEAEEVVGQILLENVITKAIDKSFVRGLILKSADFAVGESFANSMSNKKKTSASFLRYHP